MDTTQKPERSERGDGKGRGLWGAGLLLACVAAGGACAASDRGGDEKGRGLGGEAGLGGAVRLAADGATQPGEPLYVPCETEKECRYVPDRGTQRNCPTGSCDPGSNNGRGIYIGSKGNYCLKLSNDSYAACPEAFVNTANGVYLRLRDYADPAVVVEVPVKASSLDLGPVELVNVRAGDDGFAFLYANGAGQRHGWVRGEELSKFSFEFETKPSAGAPVPYALTVLDGSQAPSALWRYQVIYRRTDVAVGDWYNLCDAPQVDALASFTPGFQIDGLTAEVSDSSDAVVLGCQTGAIDTCRDWGYGGDWKEPPPFVGPDDRRDIFASCLQAKRAAYLAGYGDPTSYTVDGTEIHVLDHFGLHGDNSTMYNVRPEALWGPGGALCLTEMRHPELVNDAISKFLAPCAPFDWSEQAKLATGLP